MAFVKKEQTKIVKTDILTNTPLIYLNFEKRNILIVLHAKGPKPNDKKNIDIVLKMLQENIEIVKIIFEMLIAVSVTN